MRKFITSALMLLLCFTVSAQVPLMPNVEIDVDCEGWYESSVGEYRDGGPCPDEILGQTFYKKRMCVTYATILGVSIPIDSYFEERAECTPLYSIPESPDSDSNVIGLKCSLGEFYDKPSPTDPEETITCTVESCVWTDPITGMQHTSNREICGPIPDLVDNEQRE